MRRSLKHYWRNHLAVALGAAVATAVLTGALVVGDSVRDSLRGLILDRLGRVDHALVTDSLLREELADELAEMLGAGQEAAPVLFLRGSAEHGESGARASAVTVLGIEDRFATFFPDGDALNFERGEGQLYPSVILNHSLAEELEAGVGDAVFLSFRRSSEIPEESLVGRTDAQESVELLRLSVRSILPDGGVGGFGLAAQQSRSLNAFVEMRRLQRTLDARGEVNGLLVASTDEAPAADPTAVAAALADSVAAEDLGLILRQDGDRVVVEAESFVLDPPRVAAVEETAQALGVATMPVLSYLANDLRIGDRAVPYSTVAALDPTADERLGSLRLADGSSAPPLEPGEIYLDAWAAEDLQAQPGDMVVMDYYEVGPRDELSTTTREFRLRGIVAMEGLGVDPTLTPEFPGMSDAEDMSAWDPPFPVDLDRIGRRDEDFWDLYKATPKAFVSAAEGRELWSSRFGDRTSIRLAGSAGMSGEELERRLAEELPRRLTPGAAGLQFRAVREAGLEASTGATDFAQLFLAFSQFLIVSAALLVGLLFRLSVEQRAKEVGLLRAVGFPEKRIRRRLLGEGAVVAGLGALLGLAGAAAYAAAMLYGLRTWWLPAIGEPILFLHLRPGTLVIGWVASLAVVVFTIWWSLRRLRKVSAPALLAGSAAPPPTRRSGSRARWVAIGATGVAILLFAAALLGDAASSSGLAFGTGACLLIAGLAAFAHWTRPSGRHSANSLGNSALAGMGARNAARNPGRSQLSLALVACACFMIVVVAANRGEPEVDLEDRSSGAGGFDLMAESDIPLLQDLADAQRREEMGFSAEDSQRLEGSDVVPFRLLPGEDASCLNLYAPQQPRILGVTPQMVERGGFRFQQQVREAENPWTLLDDELEPGVVPAIADANSAIWILKKGLGDDLEVQTERGETLKLRLVGLLATSLFQSELLISEEAFTEHFPSRTGYGYFLVDTPPERSAEVATAMETSLGRLGMDATGSAEKLAAFHAVQNTYISTFQTLGGLGLLLGTVGLGIVLLRNVLERRGELATLRAFGFRRRRISALVVAENAFLLVLGIALGTFAALVAVAPRLITHGSEVPWPSLATILGLVLAVGLLSSLAAVVVGARVPLLASLKEE